MSLGIAALQRAAEVPREETLMFKGMDACVKAINEGRYVEGLAEFMRVPSLRTDIVCGLLDEGRGLEQLVENFEQDNTESGKESPFQNLDIKKRFGSYRRLNKNRVICTNVS